MAWTRCPRFSSQLPQCAQASLLSAVDWLAPLAPLQVAIPRDAVAVRTQAQQSTAAAAPILSASCCYMGAHTCAALTDICLCPGRHAIRLS